MDFPWRRKQHDFELPSENRIEKLIEGAKHASVTREALTETRRSRRLRSDTGWLHRRPLISYLDSGEQPHFILESTQPVEVAREQETEEIATTLPYRSFACITDCRVLLLVGQEPENWEMTIRYDDLDDFGLKPGEADPHKAEGVEIASTFTPELRLKDDSVRYLFINETSLTLRDVRSLGSLLKSQFSEDRWEYEAFWENATRVRKEKRQEAAERQRRQMERQQQKRHEEVERRQQEQLQREAAERERREALETLAAKSASTSVTPERLEPIFDHLYEGETVDFVLWGGQRGVALFSPDGEVELIRETAQEWTAVTSDRILFPSGDGVDQISYERPENARVGRIPRRPTESWESYDDSPAVILTGDEFVYYFEVSAFSLPHLHDLVEVVRKYIGESS